MITAFFILCGGVIATGIGLNLWLRRRTSRLPLMPLSPDQVRRAGGIPAGDVTWPRDDDQGVSGDSIARLRRSQRKLDAARDKKLTEGIEKILSEADGNG